MNLSGKRNWMMRQDIARGQSKMESTSESLGVGTGKGEKSKKLLMDGSSQGHREVEEGRLEQGWTRIWE